MTGHEAGMAYGAKVQIRALESSDDDRIAALHAACFERPWPAADMARMLGISTITGFLAGQEARPSGFILAQFPGEDAEILTIAVHPSARKRGIGQALLSALITHARGSGVRSLFLEVAADNDAALRLYHKAGFVPVGLRKAYYGRRDGPVDAHVLQRILT